MAGINNKYLLGIMGKLQPSEVEKLKYILKDNFTGKSYETISILIFQLFLRSIMIFHNET